MSDKITLPLQIREGTTATKLREDGQTPAVVYGHGTETQNVSVSTRELERVYAAAGGGKIVSLKMSDGKAKNALIHDVQLDGRTGHILHADFLTIKMNEKLKTEVPLHFIGESTAVYVQEGSLMRALETVEIEALPGDLPDSLEVDISVLDDFDKSITVADLTVPSGVAILTPAEDLIAKVDPPRSEEELEDLDAPIDEAAEMPEGVQEDTEVIEEEQQTDKEPQNKAAGADPAATK